jgi:uncharacterized membrane protein YedE/YeeE
MKGRAWIFWLLASLLFLGITLAYALSRGLVALAGLPLGFLFGYFLHKGDLCGASAFSEVLLMRDNRKVWGMWICIVTSMAVFAALDLAGWITLTPKPMLWMSFLVGGLIFGAGTVLAGGCVSGCLYKGSAGNINSIMALMGMPLGMALVEYGPLSGLNKAMLAHAIKNSDGSPVTLGSLSGLPFWLLAMLFVAATLGVAFWMRGKKENIAGPRITSTAPLFRRLMTRPWKPWHAGLAIGLLAGPLYLSSAASGRNYPVGVTHGVLHAYLLATEPAVQGSLKAPAPKPAEIVAKPGQGGSTAQPPPASAAPAPQTKKVSFWLIFVVLGLILGSHVSARMGGASKLLPKEPQQTFLALFGGILVGMGAWFATGCVIGNILSGWALMSVGLLVFGAATILSNWGVTYVYLMGGWSRSK